MAFSLKSKNVLLNGPTPDCYYFCSLQTQIFTEKNVSFSRIRTQIVEVGLLRWPPLPPPRPKSKNVKNKIFGRDLTVIGFNKWSSFQLRHCLVHLCSCFILSATIANGVVNACRSIDLKLPLVVRLEGTNVEAAKKILAESGLPIKRWVSFFPMIIVF